MSAVWSARFFLTWGFLFACPVLLVVGALLVLIGIAPKTGSWLIILGAAGLTGWALYMAAGVPGDQARLGVHVGWIVIVAITLIVALAADFAAYRIYKAASGLP